MNSQSRPAAIAMLVDGDNIAPGYLPTILLEAGKFGAVTVRRVYANFHLRASWQEMMTMYGCVGMQRWPTANGKNATDIALSIDALDLWHQGMRAFCVASGDSDFSPLALRLREDHGLVVGIGKRPTEALLHACTVYFEVHESLPLLQPLPSLTTVSLSSSLESGAPQSMPSLELPQKPHDVLATLFREVHRQIAGTPKAWVLMSALGAAVKRIDPTFTVQEHGYASLSKLVLARSDLFEMRALEHGIYEVRLIVVRSPSG